MPNINKRKPAHHTTLWTPRRCWHLYLLVEIKILCLYDELVFTVLTDFRLLFHVLCFKLYELYYFCIVTLLAVEHFWFFWRIGCFKFSWTSTIFMKMPNGIFIRLIF